jgi:hypothetical protein
MLWFLEMCVLPSNTLSAMAATSPVSTKTLKATLVLRVILLTPRNYFASSNRPNIVLFLDQFLELPAVGFPLNFSRFPLQAGCGELLAAWKGLCTLKLLFVQRRIGSHAVQ